MSAAIDADLPLDAPGVGGEAAPPASSLAGAAAGVILWRSGGGLLWVDAGAQQVVAGCDAGLLDVLAADARSLGTGRSCSMVERVVAARLSGWVRARSQSCAAGGAVVAVTVVETVRAVDRSPVDLAQRFQLTEKELEIVKLVTEGHGNRAIGYRVGLATPTVGMYLTRIFRKTGAIDRQDLTRLVLTDLSRGLSTAPRDLQAPVPAPAPTAPVTLVALPPLPPEPALPQPVGAWRSGPTRSRRAGEPARRWRGP